MACMGGAPPAPATGAAAPPPAGAAPASPSGAAAAACSPPAAPICARSSGVRRGGWRVAITSCSRYPAMKPTRMPMVAKRRLSRFTSRLAFTHRGPAPTVGAAGDQFIGRPGARDPSVGHRAFPYAVEATAGVDALQTQASRREGAAEGAAGRAAYLVGAAHHRAVEPQVEDRAQVLGRDGDPPAAGDGVGLPAGGGLALQQADAPQALLQPLELRGHPVLGHAGGGAGGVQLALQTLQRAEGHGVAGESLVEPAEDVLQPLPHPPVLLPRLAVGHQVEGQELALDAQLGLHRALARREDGRALGDRRRPGGQQRGQEHEARRYEGSEHAGRIVAGPAQMRRPLGRAAFQETPVAWSGSARGFPLPLLQAAVERLLYQRLRLTFYDALDVGDLADDEVLGPLVHLLLAEGEALALRDEPQVLEHLRHVGETAGLHLVEVLLVPPLPILVRVDIAVLEDVQKSPDVACVAQRTQADQLEVGLRHHHFGVVGKETEMKVELLHPVHVAWLDLLDQGYTVVGVYHLLTDSECQVGTP